MKLAEVFLTTKMVEPHLRTEFWRNVTRPFYDTTNVDLAAKLPLEGSLSSRALGSIHIGPTSFNRQHHRRDRRIVLESGLDQYFIQLYVTGSVRGDCEGRRFSAGPGDITVVDLARLFVTQVEVGSTISLMIPRQRIELATRGRSIHGLVLKAGLPVTKLVAEFIESLSHIAGELGSAQLLDVEESVITLLASCLAQGDSSAIDDAALTPVLMHSMLNFIDANVADPELGPPLLIQRFRISRAHLYRMFSADNGVARVIRERRLDATYRMLISPNVLDWSIAQIAFAYGFSGSGQFQRAFASRFELSPTEARQMGSATILADRKLIALHTELANYGRHIKSSQQMIGAPKDPHPYWPYSRRVGHCRLRG